MSIEDLIFAVRLVKAVQMMIDLVHGETTAFVAIYIVFGMTKGKGSHISFASLLYVVIILWR